MTTLGSSNARSLTDLALERVRYEYTELADNWKVLESKAQATATAAGVFLAAVFAFVAHDDPSVLDHTVPRVLATLVVVCVTVAIMCAMASLWVRELEMPTSGQTTWDMVQAAMAGATQDADLSAAHQKVLERFVQDWVACNRDIERNSNSKAAWIWRAQVSLVVGAVIAATLAIVSVWT